MKLPVSTFSLPLILVLILLAAFLLPCAPASAQSFGDAAGMMQGERIARVTTLLDDTLHAGTDTTAWLPFGTHVASLAGERPYAPTRFTLFVKVDTASVPHAAAPSIQLAAQVALSDTAIPYEQLDGSLTLAPSTNPITSTTGQSMIVPIYGGGYVRFITTSTDTARVRLDLWRVR
ncbi:hypothetical protein KQI63_04005 [bacterium]|nr:hypothetical protein [bacterium]